MEPTTILLTAVAAMQLFQLCIRLFGDGIRFRGNLEELLQARVDGAKDELVKQFEAKLAQATKELVKQFQGQLDQAKNAWMAELESRLTAEKGEWLQEMKALKDQQESTSTRLAQTETKVDGVTDAIATLFRVTAKRMGESEGDYLQAAEKLMPNPAPQPRNSDADSQ